jgi:sugar O-acyltransferase (sialic acid O-acetyltransferase NeuD family)
MMRDLVIVGAGGHGRELLDIVEAANSLSPTWSFCGFLDDGCASTDPLERRGRCIIGPVSRLPKLDAAYVIGIGDSEIRQRIDRVATRAGCEAAILLHPLASCGSDVKLAAGVVLAAGARVTTNVRLGRHTHINVNAVVSHDCRIADFVTLSPGSLANGSVTLEEHVMLGSGAVVSPGHVVGRRSWVGAGAVVVDDLPADVVATGVPARVTRTR